MRRPLAILALVVVAVSGCTGASDKPVQPGAGVSATSGSAKVSEARVRAAYLKSVREQGSITEGQQSDYGLISLAGLMCDNLRSGKFTMAEMHDMLVSGAGSQQAGEAIMGNGMAAFCPEQLNKL